MYNVLKHTLIVRGIDRFVYSQNLCNFVIIIVLLDFLFASKHPTVYKHISFFIQINQYVNFEAIFVVTSWRLASNKVVVPSEGGNNSC